MQRECLDFGLQNISPFAGDIKAVLPIDNSIFDSEMDQSSTQSAEFTTELEEDPINPVTDEVVFVVEMEKDCENETEGSKNLRA